jgi:type IV fimbrial biogenesis protein FimT
MQIATRRTQGFTLIELMMTMTILTILIAAAAPAFGNLIQNTEAQTSRSTLTTALALHASSP